MTDAQSPTKAFRAARDLLLRLREDYPAAQAEFTWPQLDEFNWALDWFDVIAAEHPDRDALRIVADGDAAARISYGEMAARSGQVANWLRGLGARRGDRLLLMLGNIAPLWEIILAAMKLGVVIIPASTLLGPEDLADRVARGDVRHVITEYGHTPRFAERHGRLDAGSGQHGTRGHSAGGLARLRGGGLGQHPLRAGRPDSGGRSVAAVFHLRDHGPAETGGAYARLLPGRPPVHDVLDRAAARGRAPEHVLPGLGQARVEQRVRAVERRGDRARARLRAVFRPGADGRDRRLRQ